MPQATAGPLVTPTKPISSVSFAAVMERRLPPNTKLSDSMLCETSGVGRIRVRRALLLLTSQGIVNLYSNRGAFVARLALEPSVVHQIAEAAGTGGLEALERHIELEQQGHSGRNRREAVRYEDSDGADALIRAHLAHIEADLDLSASRSEQPDLAEILGQP